MKHALAIFSIFLFFSNFSFAQESNDWKRVHPKYIKAYWVVPLSSNTEWDETFIEVNLCYLKKVANTQNCLTNLIQIPVREILTGQTWKAYTEGKTAKLDHLYSGDFNEVVNIAQSTAQNGWFPKVELCQEKNPEKRCRYVVEWSASAQSIRLRVIY